MGSGAIFASHGWRRGLGYFAPTELCAAVKCGTSPEPAQTFSPDSHRVGSCVKVCAIPARRCDSLSEAQEWGMEGRHSGCARGLTARPAQVATTWNPRRRRQHSPGGAKSCSPGRQPGVSLTHVCLAVPLVPGVGHTGHERDDLNGLRRDLRIPRLAPWARLFRSYGALRRRQVRHLSRTGADLVAGQPPSWLLCEGLRLPRKRRF